MSTPTVAVTCIASDPNGNRVPGARYRALLSRTELYDGFVVPEPVEAVADANGTCVLHLWPNALGVAGSRYRITAVNPATSRFFLNELVSVPDSDCNLHQILEATPYPTVDASEQALKDLQDALAQIEAIRQNIIDLAASIGTGGGTGGTTYTHPANHPPSIITQDANNRFTTDAEKATWNGKQAALGFTPEQTGAAVGVLNGHLAAPDPHAQYTTADELDAAISGKADVATTLSGYGITDADAAGTAAGLLTAHAAAADPHPGYALESTIGAANGIAPLDGAGKVAAAFLPSFVDDVLEVASYAALPATGEAGKIYTTLDDNKIYRWGGSAYVTIAASPGSTDNVTEGATNLYFSAARVRATVLAGLSTAAGTVVTAAHTVLQAIGFLQKQVSDNATAISGKQDALVSGNNLRPVNGQSLLGSTNLVISADLTSPGPIGGTTPGSVAATSVTATGGMSAVTGAYNIAYTWAAAGTTYPAGIGGNFSAMTIVLSGQTAVFLGASSFSVLPGTGIGFSSSATNASFADTLTYRDAAGIIAQRNGTNAQTQRIYGIWTDASNYRRVALAMTTAGVATLKSEGAGTGASGNVLHISGLPTSNPGPGILWNNAGSVAIGT